MSEPTGQGVTTLLRRVRQIRQYADRPVGEVELEEILEVARWTGSSRNTQPWHFVVVRDAATIRRLSEIRTPINWVAAAPVVIALVLDGRSAVSEAYDEGRVTERILVAANALGLGGGTAWYGDDAQRVAAREILGIPDGLEARSLVAVGHPVSVRDPRPNAVDGGRRPLADLVHHDRW